MGKIGFMISHFGKLAKGEGDLKLNSKKYKEELNKDGLRVRIWEIKKDGSEQLVWGNEEAEGGYYNI
jgi:hypothetical protein